MKTPLSGVNEIKLKSHRALLSKVKWEWFLNFLIGNSRAYGGCLD